VKAD